MLLQHFDTTFGEYPRDGGTPPFECVNIGERTDPVGQPKWRLNQDCSLSILDERFSQLAVGGWRNQVLSHAKYARDSSYVKAGNEAECEDVSASQADSGPGLSGW